MSINNLSNKKSKILKKIYDNLKSSNDNPLKIEEKKKEFQTRFEVFKDALDKGSNSIAKSQAQFIKDHYGIDVKQFKLDNLSKMGEFFKNNVATLDKKRKVGSLLNNGQKLQNQKNTILNKYNKELKTFEKKQGYSQSEQSSSKPSNNFQKTKKGKKLADEFKKLQEQINKIEIQKSNNYNITKQVIDNKIKSNVNNYNKEFEKFSNGYSGPKDKDNAKKDFDETPNGKKYKKHIEDLKKEKNKIENILNIQNKIKSLNGSNTPLKKTNTPDKNPITPVIKPKPSVIKPKPPVIKPKPSVIKPKPPVNKPKPPVNEPRISKKVTFALPDKTNTSVNEPKPQPKRVSFALPDINGTLVGGHLPKRLHPKKKYSKKAYQFSKSKNRTKKQLI